MHANDWSGENISGWYCSEKLDGWRCLWTGTQYLTRSGAVLPVPPEWIAGMPTTPLDGELWLGRGFDHTDVHRAVARGEWSALRFCPFDIPGAKIERAITMLTSLELPRHCAPVAFWRVESTRDARSAMAEIARSGGEGLMVRKPGSDYVPYRCDTLLKLKP